MADLLTYFRYLLTILLLLIASFFLMLRRWKRAKRSIEPCFMPVLEVEALSYNGPYIHIHRICSEPQHELLETEMHANATVYFRFEGEEVPHDNYHELPTFPVKTLGTSVFSHNCPFGIVGTEPVNLFAAIKARITANTPDPTIPNILQRTAHLLTSQRAPLITDNHTINSIVHSFLRDDVIPSTIKELLERYSGPKLKRYTRAVEKALVDDDQYMIGEINELNYKNIIKKIKEKGNDIFHKREKLPYKDKEGFGKLKPRLIVNPDVEVQIWLMRYEKVMKKKFKEFTEEPFNLDTKEHGKLKVRFDFAANVGTDTASLTAWLQQALQDLDDNIWTYILMGDDIFGVTLKDDLPFFVELDYSAFDSTQKDDAIYSEHYIYEFLGMTHEACLVSMAQHDAPMSTFKFLKHDGNRFVFHADVALKHLIRISGGWNTSMGGSIVNMLGLVNTLTTMDSHSYNTFNEVGFKVKMSAFRLTENVMESTFLKCGFTLDGDCTILPSKILKVGTYTKNLSLEDALTFLKGDVLGWGDIPEDFPILGAFRRKVCSLVNHKGEDSRKETLKYRVQHTTGNLCREKILEMMFARYKCTIEEVELLEAKIDGILSFPWHISDELLAKFMERDY